MSIEPYKLAEALNHAYILLGQDGWTQIQTVEEWLTEAYNRPGEFEDSEGALDILRLLGLESKEVKPLE